jgi:hypothetical protein
VRYLEIVDNLGASAGTVNLRLSTNLGSDDGTQVLGTSSGDLELDAQDDWLVTDDGPAGDPTIVQVVSGADSPLGPTAAEQLGDDVRFTFQDMTVPAGGRVILMHFASQNVDEETALASAGAIVALQGSTLAGMSQQERAAVVNFRASLEGG